MAEGVRLRPYDPDRDEDAVLDLWRQGLGASWPLPPRAFRHITLEGGRYAAGDHVVAEAGAGVVGFAATQIREPQPAAAARGAVLAVLVAEGFRRRGVGRALLRAALEALRGRGAAEVQLGGGAASYFWPGVPADPADAWPFFAAQGWPAVETSYDLVADLRGADTPGWVWERARQAGAAIRRAAAEDVPAVLAFEERHFPGWYPFYRDTAARGGAGEILLAADPSGEVAGTALVLSPQSAEWRARFPWPALLGENTGGIGVLGVREDRQGQGIGTALAARAGELLRDQGVARSYVGWTWLVDWYGKIGYRVWRQYTMSWRSL